MVWAGAVGVGGSWLALANHEPAALPEPSPSLPLLPGCARPFRLFQTLYIYIYIALPVAILAQAIYSGLCLAASLFAAHAAHCEVREVRQV